MPADHPQSDGVVCPERPLRVMRVLTRPNLGGPTRQAIALWHAHQELGVSTLLVTGVVDESEVALSPAAHGVPLAPADGSGPGWLQLRHLQRGMHIRGDRRALADLRRMTRSFAPDVVHTHTSKAGLLGRKAALAEQVAAVAHTFHGHVLKDYFGKLPSKLLALLERRLAKRTDLLFAISKSCAQELSECRVAALERFLVIPPAVPMPMPLSREVARQQLGIAPQQWRVCAVGRLVPIKRLADFVAAVAQVDDLSGDVIGDGPERDALQYLAAQHDRDRIRIRGAEPDIARLLPAYDAVVLPSVREGCPLVAIEAFAAGVPVVGYDVPGVRDALSQFGSGLLVPEAQGSAGLARALLALRADAKVTAGLVAQSKLAVDRCRPGAVASQLLASYQGALAAHGK